MGAQRLPHPEERGAGGASRRTREALPPAAGLGAYFAVIFVLRETVSRKVSLLATDRWSGYIKLGAKYPRAVIDHANGSDVVGIIHTNTIEGFWSIFKRGIVSTFRNISKKYLHLYVAEFQFRYDNRFNDDFFGTAIKGC